MPISKQDLNTIYKVMLNRSVDPTGIDVYLNFANNNNISNPFEIAKLIAQSVEFRNMHYSNTTEGFNLVRHIYMDLQFELPEFDFTAASIGDGAIYEPYVSNHLFKNLLDVKVFVDIGANLGLFALPVAKILSERGQVYAFEASTQNARLLHNNKVLNKIENVTIYPIAVGDYNGVAFSYDPRTTSNRTLIAEAVMGSGVDLMPIVRFDNFWPADIQIDIIKIDIEGFEYRFLEGAQNAIRNYMPRMYIEYSNEMQLRSSGVSGSQLLEIIFGFGYNCTILHRNKNSEKLYINKIDAIAQINRALYQHITEEKGTHLDLYFER